MAPESRSHPSRGAKHSVQLQYWRRRQRSQVTLGDYLCVISQMKPTLHRFRRVDPTGFEPASATWTECRVNGTPGLDLQQKEFKRAIRSAARSVLPNATETKIVVTANARALRYFFKVRGSIPGDLEMREVAAALFKSVQAEAPSLFADFSLETLSDGSPVLAQMKPNENG